MDVRFATAEDQPTAEIPWLGADLATPGVRVAVLDGESGIVAAAKRHPSPIHPDLDNLELWCADPTGGAAVVRFLDQHTDRDLVFATLPDRPGRQVMELLGAELLDHVPASRFDPDDPQVRAWIEEHRMDTTPGAELDTDFVADALALQWESLHADFGRMIDHQALCEYFATGLQRESGGQRLVVRDGRAVALGGTFRVGEHLMAYAESPNPDHPLARQAVAGVLADLLTDVHEPVELDGHAGGPHHAHVLATIPNVTPGPLTPLYLYRLRSSHPTGGVA